MRSAVYKRYLAILLLIGVVGGLGGAVARLNTFGCYAPGPSTFIAVCETRRFGDFEHGAYAFSLRPQAIAALQAAQVVFVGNSRLQAALSTEITRRHFAERGQRHYLLGFGHAEESGFAAFLARKHALAPKVLVVNADPFVTAGTSAVASELMLSPASSERSYRIKGLWQSGHRRYCEAVPQSRLCRRNPTVLRRDDDGHWQFAGFDLTRVTPADGGAGGTASSGAAAPAVRAAADLLAAFQARPACVIFTEIPTALPAVGLAEPLARALSAHAVVPAVRGLETFDKSHLTPASAARWSQAFLEAAGPILARCLVPSSEPLRGRRPRQE